MRVALEFALLESSLANWEAKMRALAGVIFGMAVVVSAEPTWAQTYDPKYPVCMEVSIGDDSHIDCWFASMDQCRNGSAGTGHCIENPYYKPPPPEPEPVAETPPQPAAKSNPPATKLKKTKQ